MTANQSTTVSRRALLRTLAGGAACLATAGVAGAASAQNGDNATDGGDGGGENATGGTDGEAAGADQPAPESAANQTAAYTLIGMLALGFLSPIVFAILVRRRMGGGS